MASSHIIKPEESKQANEHLGIDRPIDTKICCPSAAVGRFLEWVLHILDLVLIEIFGGLGR